MRGINEVVGFLLGFCLLHTAYGQSQVINVQLQENRKAGHQVYSLPLPVTNEIYTFFPGQDADSKDALTLFRISERGVITTTKPIIYESGKKNYYDLVAIRRNRGDKEGGVPTSIRITITDTNNFSPTFPRNMYYGRVKENSPQNTVVMGLENCFAEDRDTGGIQSYSISSGNEKGYFKAEMKTVSNRNFLVLKTTNVPIVMDTTPEINITVRASDGVRYGTTKVSVTIIDVNNNAPVFEEKSYAATVNEDTPLLTSVLRVRASDKDLGTNGGICYYIDNPQYFAVDPITGVIKVVRQLPNQAQVVFNVIATDRGTPSKDARVPVDIKINLIADYPPPDNPNPGINTAPVFPEESYSANVREDFPVGAALLVVHAVDRDPPGANRRLTYSLSGDSTNAFEIDQSSGVVKLRGQLDYDKIKQYNLNVRATDQGVSSQSSTASLTINVQEVDKNRNAPIFQPSNEQQLAVAIKENMPRGTQVGSLIRAVDADGSQNPDGQVVYSISSGSGLPYFSIDKDTGRLATAAILDREKQTQYDLLIEARDKALYPLYSHLYLMINISPEEDNNPAFSQPVYFAKVPEKAPAGTFVTRVHATDKDGVAVSYSLKNSRSVFEIQADSGVITTKKLLDPTVDQTTFTLYIDASAGSGGQASQGQVNVSVVSKHDSPPTFQNDPYAATVLENLGTIDSLLCIAANDFHGRPVSYSIPGGFAGKFSINSKSGRFSATGSFDYESIRTYPIQVQASSGPQQVATTDITINIRDDKDPPKLSFKKFEFSELTPAGSSQGLVITDEDTNWNNFACTIENIRSIDIVNHFNVKLESGECRLYTQSTFDHFKTPKFSFEVRATDKNNRNMYASADIEIVIKDTNNHAPEFSQSSYWASVSSNFPVRNSILKVSATDKDSGTFGEITYELLDSADRSRFSLDSTSGILSSATSLATTKYQLRVQASDRAERANEIQRKQVDVFISVYNPGDTPVAFDPPLTSYTVAENSNVNTPVFTANAKGPSGIKYSIVGGNVDNAFAINANSGRVTVQKKESLDREVKETYHLAIRAEASDRAAEATATIKLTDVNDVTPRIMFMETEPKDIAIEDFSPKGSFVIKVYAIDGDTGSAGQVKYSITTPSTPFQIDQNTGVIRTNQEIRKSQKQTYDITVQATDGGGRAQAYKLRIHVTDGLQAPQLTPSFAVSIDEDAKVGFVVRDISPTVKSPNYKYRILDGNTNDAFCINHAGVISVAKPLDREKISSYVLKVSVFVGNKVSNTTVTVTLLDRNDGVPTFTKAVYFFDVSEDKRQGQEVGKVSATDRDSGRNGLVEYYLLYTVDKNSPFQVQKDTGSITTTGPLDFEQIQQHVLYIQSTDGGSPAHSSICQVIFNVKDVNDETPKFSAASYVSKVALDKEIGAQVLLVTATDLDMIGSDNSRVVYNITSGNDEGAFVIDPDTGAIKLKKSLTTVSASQFELKVEAKDKGNPPKSSSADVKLNVFLPDGPPKFVVKPVIEEVTEGITANNRVIVVKAATSEALTYEIISGNEDGLFRIVPSTGEIMMTRVLDYEDKKQHQLVIRVMDTRDRSDQVTVILKVKNINDNKPKFPGEDGGFVERKVEDDFQIGDAAARLSAFDGDDGDSISYTLSPNAQSLFSIDNNGFLIAKKPRKEISSPVKFELTAKDSGSPPHETKVQVQLVFVTYRGNQQPVRVYVREDKEVGSVIATVPRYFPGGTLSIIFPQKSNFTVDNSGKVRMTAPFDFEQTQFYGLTVREQEPAPGGRTNDVDVEINVVDINDNKPKMTMVDYFGRVNTNSRPGTSAYQLKAEDTDGGLSGRVGYQMVSRGVPFGINPLTDGVETVGILQDRGGYNVTVFPFDYGIPRQFGDPVYLDIKTVNFKPQFSESTYKFEVFEKAPPGVVIGNVKATSASNARLGYTISQGDNEQKFNIDSTGEVKLNSLLDREKQPLYNLKVRATELIPRGYTNEVEVQITVKNANEHYPVFSDLVYVQSVNEGVGAGFSVLRVSATDCDCSECKCQAGLLKFSLEGTTLFRIDPISGDITVGPNPLDYEKVRQHTFTVVVEDFGEKIYKSRSFVRLTVQNRNDEEPQFQQSDYTIGIAEDAVTGKALAAILARDADGSPVSYSITSGNSGGFFKIDPLSGVLSLQQSVKGRTQTQYTLHVRATDTGSAKYDEVRVVVNIEDSNDNRPVFTSCPKEVFVEENKNAGEKVFQVTAVDNKDRGRNKEVEYTLIYGGDTLFRIDNTTGLITTVKSLDRETKDEHTVIVQAEDGGHGSKDEERLLSYCRIDVRVVDTNDNYPIFLTGQYYGSVWQQAGIGTTVLTISASDLDAIGKNNVDNAKVEYHLINPDDKFRVDPSTGAIITKTDMKNFQGEVQLQIRATNTQPMATTALPPDKTKTTVDIKVEVLKPPEFTKPVYTSSVKENVALDSEILTITATSGRKNKMSYSLVKSDQEGEQKFKVDPNDGKISTASTLDYEQRKLYRLQFKAEESITELSAFCDVIITIIDVNDDSPTFKLAEYNARVPENAAPGFNMITIEADDRDTGVSGEVTYSLDKLQNFAINLNSGVVTTKTSFDRENPGDNLITVTAQDKGTPPLKAEISVKVKIVDQNDQPPIFPKPRYEAKVPENAAIGYSIIDLTATDADIGDNARLDYFVSSGDSSQNFRMETLVRPQNYGKLLLDGKLDYETKKTYTIKVTATDRKDSATVDVVITVIDTNDNVPQFASLIYEASILENSNPGVQVIKVSATDADSPNIQSKLQYSLDATGQRYFAINADNGQITTANEKLDREKDQIVSFYVYASDGKHRGRALVRVTLGDINDNAPYFPNPPYVGYVEENLDPGASVMVLQAVDLDIGINAEIVYNLENNANNKFKIDRVSGLLTTLETLEKETAVNEFTITVKATDKGNPALSGTVTATIKVADGNDQTPVFNPTVYNAKVPEDALPGYLVTVVTATDKDEGVNAQLEYTITAGNDPYEFYINPRTGNILVSGLLDFDHGKKQYNLTVMVSDHGNPPKQAVKPAFVYITVLDSNDNPPVFVPAEYNKKVTENLKPGQTVLLVTAVDQDTGTNAQFTFAVADGDDADMFAIRPNANNASIGEIYTLLQLDRETVPQYNLTITATDTGGLQGFALVRLTLTDYNDNGPWFVPRYYEGSVKASINQEQVVTTLRAYDPDEASNGSPFTFSVETHKDRFALRDDTKDPDTADILFSKGIFNRQVKPFWEVKIKAVDSGSPRMNNETWAYIQVVDDTNTNEPFDGSLTIIVNAKDGKFTGGVIGKAYYRDKDYLGDKNKYTMASQEYFTVNEGNGDITAEANVPVGQYNFDIDVEEQKQRSGNFPKTVTSKVTVYVQSVTSAAILQSVALQILALRKPAFFVADYYVKLREVLAKVLSSSSDSVLIFSIQRAPSSRVPIKDLFGLEIQFAVEISAGSFMDRAEVMKLLIANRQTLTDLGLNIGKIGIDVCAYENEDVGKCINKVEASSQYTVVSGYYGQLVSNDAPESSLTVVSMDITLKAEYVSVIPPNINCSTGNPCLHGGTCHNAFPSGIICECGRDYRGPMCQSTTRTFTGSSYLHLEKLIAYERSRLELGFMTGTANGLVLYQGPVSQGANNGLPDVMALIMVEGFMKLVITLGPHPNAPLELYLNKGPRLDDKTWHRVEVIRELKKVTLRIDQCAHSAIVEDDGQVIENRENCEIVGEIWGSQIYLDGFGPLQIGGVKNSDVSSLFPEINFGGFVGCIRSIWDNDFVYDLMNPLEEKDTTLGCKLNDNACPDCSGKGYCEPKWENSICVCDIGYSGPNCNKRTSAIWYKPNSFTQYKVKQSRRKRRELIPPPVSMSNEFYTNIALHVRISPNSSNVVVFLASNSLGTEFNRIDVKNHVLRYVFRLGNRMKILKIPQLNVTDDKYHTVIVRREGNWAMLQIDYNGRVYGTTGGMHKLLNMGGGSFFTGGLPNITEVRVVEAFVNSGGNAILRTADGNIISSGVGSGFGGYGTSNAAFGGSWITVGACGQVSVSSTTGASVNLAYPDGVRGLADGRGRVFIGRSGKQSYKQSYKQSSYSGSGVSVRIISTSYSRGGKVVISSSSSSGSGGSGGGSDGSGGAGGASGGASGGALGQVSGCASGGSGGVVGGGSGGSGASGGHVGVGGVVTGTTVLGGARTMGTNGAIGAYGSGFGIWTLSGATADEPKEIEVIGDFGGCTATNSYNGVDLDSDPKIEARRQNVVNPCPCSSADLCLHGGTCVGASPPYCICPPGWAGPRCGDVVTEPKPGTRPGSRWANPAVIACILVIVLAILIIIGAVLLKRRPEPTVVAVVEDGHVHDNVRPYHDEGAGEEDNFGYDITTLMKYTYVENGMAGAGGAGGAGYGKFKNGGSTNGEEEFTVSESKPLLQGAIPGAGLHHGVTTITKRRVVHPDSIDVKQFIDTRVHEADGEYILSIDELHIYRYEGDDSDVDDLSELGDSDEEPDEEEEQEFAFLQEWGRKFDNLNHIFNDDD